MGDHGTESHGSEKTAGLPQCRQTTRFPDFGRRVFCFFREVVSKQEKEALQWSRKQTKAKLPEMEMNLS